MITQSAVSHHIKQLETALGTRLFQRKSKSIELTEEGAAFLATVDHALSLLAKGTAEARSRSGRTAVRVSLLPSFAAKWLVSRLERFQKEYPTIDLDLDPTLRVVDVRRGEADVAIRFGDFSSDKQGGIHLLNEELSPVMSPVLYGDGSRFKSPYDLLCQPILQAKNGLEWQLWSREAGLRIDEGKQVRLTDYNVVLQAALDGQGIAMGRNLLIKEDLRQGRLIKPLPISFSSEKAAYWAACDPNSKNVTIIEAFLAWLKTELQL